MKNMNKILLSIWLTLFASAALGAGGHGAKLDAVNVDLSDTPSLQRGARLFVNYCLSCHSAAYMRYNRVGHDLDIPEDLLKANLMFASDKPGELMKTAMRPEDAKKWFGTVPPDLTVIARARSPEWLYTYMRSFYRDDKSATGWNNTVFPDVAMPHVLYDVQGEQRALYDTVKDKDGGAQQVFRKLELARAGSMDEKAYNAAMRDLTNFLVYLGEPAKLERYRLGVLVIIFLLFLLVFAYLLKKEYWKDVK